MKDDDADRCMVGDGSLLGYYDGMNE